MATPAVAPKLLIGSIAWWGLGTVGIPPPHNVWKAKTEKRVQETLYRAYSGDLTFSTTYRFCCLIKDTV